MYETHPYPGELANGLVGRLRVLNRHANCQQTVFSLRAHCEMAYKLPRTATLPEMLATACGKTSEEFAQRHTLLPYHRAVSRRTPELSHGDARDWQILRRSGMVLAREFVYVCRDCIAEARREFGCSFYQRVHQVPGIDWCERHHRPLSTLPSEGAFDLPPHWQERSAIDLRVDVASNLDNPIIARYVKVIVGFLERAHPVPVQLAGQRLTERAQALGLATRGKPTRKTLGSLALKSLPHPWVKALLLNPGTSSDTARTLDNFIMAPGNLRRGCIYALAAALLYQSAEHALAELCNPLDMKLAASSPVSDLRGRPKSTSSVEQAAAFALEMFLAGKGLAEACLSAGADRHDVERLLRAANRNARAAPALAITARRRFAYRA